MRHCAKCASIRHASRRYQEISPRVWNLTPNSSHFPPWFLSPRKSAKMARPVPAIPLRRRSRHHPYARATAALDRAFRYHPAPPAPSPQMLMCSTSRRQTPSRYFCASEAEAAMSFLADSCAPALPTISRQSVSPPAVYVPSSFHQSSMVRLISRDSSAPQTRFVDSPTCMSQVLNRDSNVIARDTLRL